MTTYILTNHKGFWSLDRQRGDDVLHIAVNLSPTEAVDLATKLAEEIRPSRILRLAEKGEYELLAKFEVIDAHL
ncbi:MAG TPA: hypothetical protein VFH95_09955 [Candidatus Kapabacteria bacterium]|nr:hypothetical protein [Candidatus Kapabacteria bacterium]